MSFNISYFTRGTNFFISLFTIILTACSNKDLYQVGQYYQKIECINKTKSPEQHAECTNIKSQTYE